jgi:DtxR family Mn-dependent transcriptional regulator
VHENLTPALEDYLEIILRLTEENGKATISEIANRLKITKPSANQAINNLRREGLVTQDRYGPVYLTETGSQKAEQVWQRHQTISGFLHDVLKVSASVAEHDACMMEHIISTETLTAMKSMLSDLQPRKQRTALQTSLADLNVGEKARIIRIGKQNLQLRKRIMEMGLVPGAIIEMQRLAPLGDPLEVAMKGYHLSLRKEEAALIQVELLKD